MLQGNLHSVLTQFAKFGSILEANSLTICCVNSPLDDKLSRDNTVNGRKPRLHRISSARTKNPGPDFGTKLCRSCLISGCSKSSFVSREPRQYPFSVMVRLTILVVSSVITLSTALGSSGAKRTEVTTSTT